MEDKLGDDDAYVFELWSLKNIPNLVEGFVKIEIMVWGKIVPSPSEM